MKTLNTFGFGCLGDGATINLMPLLNILAIQGDKTLLLFICDPAKNMMEGVKKYPLVKAKQQTEYFCGTPNVQKASAIS